MRRAPKACSRSPSSRSSWTKGGRRAARPSWRCSAARWAAWTSRPRRRRRGCPPRPSSGWPTRPRPRRAGLALGGGVGVTGTNATETQIAINLLNVALGAYPKLVRFGGDSAFGKASPYAEMLSLTEAMGKGEVEVLILADVNPVFTMPAQVGLRRGARQGSARREPGQSAQRDGVARGPRLARAPSARVVGGFCRRGRRDRAHAADHGARPDRRQAGGRQVHRRYPAVRRPPGAGRGCRQGPAQVGELRGAGEGRVEEARQGLRGRAALHRFLASLSRARGRLALRAWPRRRRPRPTCRESRRRPRSSKGKDRTRSSSTRPRASTTGGAPTSRGCRKRRTS